MHSLLVANSKVYDLRPAVPRYIGCVASDKIPKLLYAKKPTYRGLLAACRRTNGSTKPSIMRMTMAQVGSTKQKLQESRKPIIDYERIERYCDMRSIR